MKATIGLTYERAVKLCDIKALSLPGDLHSIWHQGRVVNRKLWSLDITNMYILTGTSDVTHFELSFILRFDILYC